MFLNWSLQKKILVFFLAGTLATLGLDRILVGNLFFYFPNELEWDTSPWYNFLHHRKQIRLDSEKNTVLVAGSSVALYSALPEKIEAKLENADVALYSHVAMSAADLYYYADDIVARRPDVLLYLFNPADFQLDHFMEKNGHYEYSETHWIKEYQTRYPVLMIYPFSFLLEYSPILPGSQILNLLSKSVLKTNRYRQFISDPLHAYAERHFRKARSFHTYTGSVPDNGIWGRGWTNPEFTVDCDLDKGRFRESVYIPVRGSLLTIKYKDRELYRILYNTTGWKQIDLSLNLPVDRIQLQFTTNKTISSRVAENMQYGKEYEYGIRLAQNFCKKDMEQNISYSRIKTLEDDRFEGMTIDEYKKDYHDRLYYNWQNRRELYRLWHIRSRKESLARQDFAVWKELEYIERLSKKMKAAGIRFVVVNNPENPLELDIYAGSKWYNGFLQYFQRQKDITFYDRKEFVRDIRMFVDFHHLTYHGAVFMASEYANILSKNIGSKGEEK